MHGLDYAGFDVTGLTAQATLDACYETCKLFSGKFDICMSSFSKALIALFLTCSCR
jgi:hypothetical protein